MLILSADQVEYCSVVPVEGDPSEAIAGIAYQQKLFTQRKQFPKQQKQAAIQRAKQLVLKHKAKFLVLVIEETDSYQIWIQNPQVKELVPERPPIVEVDLEKVVGKMLNVGGLDIAKRQYRLKSYPRCFVGSEAVAWLQDKLGFTQEEAIQLGQRMIDERWIHHVTNDHGFKDEYLFYRFYRDEE